MADKTFYLSDEGVKAKKISAAKQMLLLFLGISLTTFVLALMYAFARGAEWRSYLYWLVLKFKYFFIADVLGNAGLCFFCYWAITSRLSQHHLILAENEVRVGAQEHYFSMPYNSITRLSLDRLPDGRVDSIKLFSGEVLAKSLAGYHNMDTLVSEIQSKVGANLTVKDA